MSDYIKNKGAGFWITAVSCLLGLVTAIIYAANYANRIIGGQTVISWPAFALLLVAVTANLLLLFIKRSNFAPPLSALLNGLALMFFIYGAYNYVAVVAVGIDADLDPVFVFTCVLFALTFILNISNIFFRQEKKKEYQTA